MEDFSKYVETPNVTVGEIPNSVVYIPLMSKNKIIGAFTVQSFNSHAFTSYHLSILRSLAEYITIAIENASLYADMEQRVLSRTKEINQAYTNTKILSDISKEISSSLNSEAIISRVYNHVNQLMDATMFGIGIYDKSKNIIKMPGFIEKENKMDDFHYDMNDERLAVWCFNNQQNIIINDYEKERINYRMLISFLN